MHKNIYLLFITLPTIALASVGLLFNAGVARAATGLKISPATLELMIQPNKKLLQTITVENLGEATTYQVSLKHLVPVGNIGGSTFDPQEVVDSNTLPVLITLNNKSLNNQELTLPSGSSTFTLTINTPSSDKNTELYIALAFTPIISLTSKVQNSPSVGLPLLITVSPDGSFDYKLELSGFALPFVHDSQTPLAITPSLKNTGATMLRPLTQMTMTSPIGLTTNYVFQNNLILAGTTRALTLDNAQTLILNSSIKRFGPYTFTLKTTTAGGKEVIASTRVVWFLPLRLILILTTLICLTLLIVWLGRNKSKSLTQMGN